jgi:hypothetical protein
MPILYKYLIELLFIVLTFLGGALLGYEHEHKHLEAIEAQQKILSKQQEDAVKVLNKKIEDNANEATTQLQDSAKTITDYYANHPNVVVRVHHDGACSLSGTVSDTSLVNDAPTSADVTAYVSPYPPESCEVVANQLDELQKLLIKDGVTVK